MTLKGEGRQGGGEEGGSRGCVISGRGREGGGEGEGSLEG